MKRNLIYYVLFLSVFSCPLVYPQITITKDDVLRRYTPGKVIATNMDVSIIELNIGKAGGDNSWDFSSLKSKFISTSTVLEPASTPFKSDFPEANLALQATSFGNEDTSELYFPEVWSYSLLKDNFLTLGTAGRGKAMGMDVESKTFNSPALIFVKLPVVFGDAWTQTCHDSIVSKFGDLDTYSKGKTEINTVVDAYGVMKMPGGYSVEALRIRRDLKGLIESQFGQVSRRRSVEYVFQGKNGDMVTVPALDTLSPDNGDIKTGAVVWAENRLTEVVQNAVIPGGYSLSRNYPNPFNPETMLEYTIPEETYLDIRVFDILGREVSVLAGTTVKPGTYNIKFNGNDLPGGIYILRMKAGTFRGFGKMMLLK